MEPVFEYKTDIDVEASDEEEDSDNHNDSNKNNHSNLDPLETVLNGDSGLGINYCYRYNFTSIFLYMFYKFFFIFTLFFVYMSHGCKSAQFFFSHKTFLYYYNTNS